MWDGLELAGWLSVSHCIFLTHCFLKVTINGFLPLRSWLIKNVLSCFSVDDLSHRDVRVIKSLNCVCLPSLAKKTIVRKSSFSLVYEHAVVQGRLWYQFIRGSAIKTLLVSVEFITKAVYFPACTCQITPGQRRPHPSAVTTEPCRIDSGNKMTFLPQYTDGL